MKRTAYLINVGRGVIVDLADLTAAPPGGGRLPAPAWMFFEVEPLAVGPSAVGHGPMSSSRPHCAGPPSTHGCRNATWKHCSTTYRRFRRRATANAMWSINSAGADARGDGPEMGWVR